MWKLLLVAEKNFRRSNAPELLKEVYLGATYVDGVRKSKREENRLLQAWGRRCC
jgi:putative transposase